MRPEGFLISLLRHLKNWAEAYFWCPVLIASILGSAQLIYWITGRRPQENIDWLVDYSSKSIMCILIILMTSVAREAWGSWYSKEEKLAHPAFTIFQGVLTLCTAGLFAFVFLH